MTAVFVGGIFIVVGLLVLLVPLFLTELSRPGDSLWGAILSIFGFVLLIESDRFRGSPIFAVVLGGLLIVRLGQEVLQSRWMLLSEAEKLQLTSFERFSKRGTELISIFSRLITWTSQLTKNVQNKPKKAAVTKKWVREPSINEIKTPQRKNEISKEIQKVNIEVPIKELEQHLEGNAPSEEA